MQEISSQDLHDILLGSQVLGAGGGGSLSVARKFAQSVKQVEYPVRLVTVDQLPPQAIICLTSKVGPVSEPIPPHQFEQHINHLAPGDTSA